MTSLVLGPLDDLEKDEVRVVPWPGHAPPHLSLIVVAGDEGPLAFWNVCQHLPVPLDSGVGALPPGDIVCLTHGARYQPSDGLCVAGPCKGARLVRVRLERTEEGYVAYDDD